MADDEPTGFEEYSDEALHEFLDGMGDDVDRMVLNVRREVARRRRSRLRVVEDPASDE